MAARTRTLRRRERKSCSCVVSWKTVELPVGSSSGLTPGAIEFQDYTATLVGTKIYVFGGLQNRERSNKLYCFDYTTQHWIYVAVRGRKPPVRTGHTTTLYQDCLVIHGGSSAGGRTVGDIWTFDLLLERYKECPPSVARRTGHTADLIPGRGEILLFGGTSTQSLNGFTNTLVRIRLENYSSTPVEAKGQPPGRRSLHASCVCNDVLYIFGGFDDSPSRQLNDLHMLTPIVTQRGWSYLWHTPIVHGWVPRARLASTWTYAWGYIILIGGFTLSGRAGALNDVDIFDPANKTWTRCENSPGRITALDRVMITGGLVDSRDSHASLFTGTHLISLRGRLSNFDRFEVLGPAES